MFGRRRTTRTKQQPHPTPSRRRRAQSIHPTAVRMAFGGDLDHQAVTGRVIGRCGQTLSVQTTAGWAGVESDDPGLVDALDRPDVCRHQGEPVVLLNVRYGLLALAVGPAVPPRRLVVAPAVRLQDGSAVEIPGIPPQPSWLVFRCEAFVVPLHSPGSRSGSSIHH